MVVEHSSLSLTNRMYYIVLCTIFLGGFFENACIKNCLMHNKCIRFLCCCSVVGWCVKWIRPSMFCFLINVGLLYRAVSSLLGQSIEIFRLCVPLSSFYIMAKFWCLLPVSAFDQIQNLILEVGRQFPLPLVATFTVFIWSQYLGYDMRNHI